MLADLSPETRRVIAVALAYRKQHGHDMSVGALIRLAHAEDASDGAVLIVVLGLGPSPDKQPVKLSDFNARVYVGDADTRDALRHYGRRRVRAILSGPYDPWPA